MPLDPPVMTATLPSSFPITSPFVVSGQHLPPRSSRWVCRRQALSAEVRTSVVRNRSGWTTDASRNDRCPPFRIGPRLSCSRFDDFVRNAGCDASSPFDLQSEVQERLTRISEQHRRLRIYEE